MISEFGPGLSLVAFSIAAIVALVKSKLASAEKLIRSAPEEQRSALIRDSLERSHVNTEHLTKSQQYEIVIAQIAGRNARFRTTIIATLLGGVIVALLSAFAIAQSSGTQLSGVKPLRIVSGVTVDLCSEEHELEMIQSLLLPVRTVVYLDKLTVIGTHGTCGKSTEIGPPRVDTFLVRGFPEDSLWDSLFYTSDTDIFFEVDYPDHRHSYSSVRHEETYAHIYDGAFVVQAYASEGVPYIEIKPLPNSGIKLDRYECAQSLVKNGNSIDDTTRLCVSHGSVLEDLARPVGSGPCVTPPRKTVVLMGIKAVRFTRFLRLFAGTIWGQ